jgi:ubiquinone/menaquinone biosynthesis C-methylase UbiE
MISNIKNRFDSSAKEWDLEPERVKTANAVADAIIQSLQLNKDMIAMDYGAGTGLVTLKINSYVKKITAVDSSKGMLKVLEEKIKKLNIRNVDTLYWDIKRKEFEKSKYDLIVSSMTLHHIKNTKKAIDYFFNALKDGGQIGIADLEKEQGDFHFDNTGVEHFGFDREKLKTIFDEVGFKNININIVYIRTKETKNGEIKNFPIFLLTAKREF